MNSTMNDTATVIDPYVAAFLERAPEKLVDIIESRTLDGRTQELIYPHAAQLAGRRCVQRKDER
jgi:hypothetical protein